MGEQPNELDLNQAANRISVDLRCSLEHAQVLLETLVVSDRIMLIEVFGNVRREFRFNALLAHYRKNGLGKVECYLDLLPRSQQQLNAATIRMTMPLENGSEKTVEMRPIEHSYQVRSSEVLARLNSATGGDRGIGTPAKNSGRKPKDTRDQCIAELSGYYSNTVWPAREEDVNQHIREWHEKFGVREGDDGFPSLATQKSWAKRIKERRNELRKND